jgi:hypothetical protein
LLLYKKETGKTASAKELIDDIAATDTTSNKDCVFWCITRYNKGGIRRWEDMSRACVSLKKFFALLKKPNLNPPLSIRDANRIPTLVELESIVDLYKEEQITSTKELDKNGKLNFMRKNKQLFFTTTQQ